MWKGKKGHHCSIEKYLCKIGKERVNQFLKIIFKGALPQEKHKDRREPNQVLKIIFKGDLNYKKTQR
jgi:hypothetical protein